MRKCLFILMMLLLAGVGVQGQNADGSKWKLAVYVAGRMNGAVIDVETEMNAEMMVTDMLVNSGQFEMINRSSFFKEKVKNEIMEQMSGDVRYEDIAKIGEDFGAQKVCVVVVLANTESKELKVNARVIDVESKRIDASGLSKSYSYDGSLRNLDKAVEEAVNRVFGFRTFTVGNVSFKMVFVKGGTFQMGGDWGCTEDAMPMHSVTVSDFYMGEFEVTQTLWQEVMGTSIYQQRDSAIWSEFRDRVPPERKQEAIDILKQEHEIMEFFPLCGVGYSYPMYYVNHSEAKDFCRKLNNRLRDKLPAGYSFALPTEAEWEYAARGGIKTKGYWYSGGYLMPNVGWYKGNGNNTTHAVGTKRPNELGLYDMCGNVSEWCSDWYGELYYAESPKQDPQGPNSGEGRVLRGGSFDEYYPAFCRVTYRSYSRHTGLGSKTYGFRLALVYREGKRKIRQRTEKR